MTGTSVEAEALRDLLSESIGRMVTTRSEARRAAASGPARRNGVPALRAEKALAEVRDRARAIVSSADWLGIAPAERAPLYQLANQFVTGDTLDVGIDRWLAARPSAVTVDAERAESARAASAASRRPALDNAIADRVDIVRRLEAANIGQYDAVTRDIGPVGDAATTFVVTRRARPVPASVTHDQALLARTGERIRKAAAALADANDVGPAERAVLISIAHLGSTQSLDRPLARWQAVRPDRASTRTRRRRLRSAVKETP